MEMWYAVCLNRGSQQAWIADLKKKINFPEY